MKTKQKQYILWTIKVFLSKAAFNNITEELYAAQRIKLFFFLKKYVLLSDHNSAIKNLTNCMSLAVFQGYSYSLVQQRTVGSAAIQTVTYYKLKPFLSKSIPINRTKMCDEAKIRFWFDAFPTSVSLKPKPLLYMTRYTW